MSQNTTGKSKQFSRWHWTFSVIVAGVFFSFFFIQYFIERTVIEIDVVVELILLSAFIGFIIQFSSFKKKDELGILEYVLYNLFGIGPLGFLLFISINYYITIGDEIAEDHKIRSVVLNNSESSFSYGSFMLQLEGDAYYKHPSILSISMHEYKNSGEVTGVKLFFRKGLFGFKVFEGKKLITEVKRES